MDSNRITEIYAELSKYVIRLETDPASLGPKYLTDVIARCRNYLNATGRFVAEVHEERHVLQMELTALETAYDIESADLLVNDERARRLPNIEDRKAVVNVMLRDRLHAIQELRAAIQDLDIVDKAIRFRHKELKDTMSEIRLQRSLVRDELDTKAFYGDERTGAAATKASKQALDIAEMEALLDESAEQGLAEGPVPPPMLPESTERKPMDAEPTPNGLVCSVCGEPQMETPSGTICKNHHGGADGVEPTPEAEVVESEAMTDSDFDLILQNV